MWGHWKRTVFLLCLGLILSFSAAVVLSADPPDEIKPVAFLPVVRTDYPYQRWAETVSGSRANGVTAVVETAGGGFVLAGWAGNEATGWLGHLKPDGALAWQKVYEGVAFVDMNAARNDGYIAAASPDVPDGLQTVGAVVRLGPDGAVRWARYLEDDTFLALYAVDTAPNGYFLVLGYRWNHPLIWGLNGDGDVVWQRSPGSVGWYDGLRVTADGTVFVFGETQDNSAFLLTLNLDGTIAWQKTYQPSEGWDCPWIKDIVSTSDGGYAAAGNCEGDAVILKLESDGAVDWMKSYNLSNAELLSILEIEGGHLIAAGSYGHEDDIGLVMELEADGDVVWARKYATAAGGEVFSIVAPAAGGYLAIGSPNADLAWALRLDDRGRITPSCDLVEEIDVPVITHEGVAVQTLDWSNELTTYPSYLATPKVTPGELKVNRLCPTAGGGFFGSVVCPSANASSISF